MSYLWAHNRHTMKLRLRKLPGGGGSYFLDYYDRTGKRVRESLNVHLTGDRDHDKQARRLAEAICSQRSLEMAARPNGIRLHARGAVDFYAFADKRIPVICGKMGRTFHRAVSYLADLAPAPLPFDMIDESLLMRYRSHLLRSLSGETPYNYFKAMRRLLKEARQAGFLTADPSEGIRNSNPVHGTLRKDVLYPEEALLLTSARCGNTEVRRAFLFAYQTGLRLVDIKGLLWSSVDVGRRELHLVQSKTSRPVRIPLSDTAMKLLGAHGKPTVRVFKALPSDNSINKVIVNWCKRAGINKRITFSCARHSFVTAILLNTGNLKLAGSLAGHSSARITERYAHLADSQRREAVDGLPEVT